MEYPVREPLSVEFYGLPGCGKSTISHLVASKLRDKGFLVDEPSYEIDRKCNPFFRKLNKLSIYISWLLFHKYTFQKVKAIVGRNGYSGVSKIEQISNVLQKISAYQKSVQDRIVIWDQGLLQASISLSLNGKVKADDNLKGLLNILSSDIDIMSVLISVDKKVALDRMSQRPTNDSRVEKMKDDNQKHEMMLIFQHGIDVIKNGFNGLVVDGIMDLEQQVEQVVSSIRIRVS